MLSFFIASLCVFLIDLHQNAQMIRPSGFFENVFPGRLGNTRSPEQYIVNLLFSCMSPDDTAGKPDYGRIFRDGSDPRDRFPVENQKITWHREGC